MKPENILLHRESNSTTDVKMIDFGSACLTTQKGFSYVQSRYYRAPEVILGIDYSTEIDMWSLGCIVAELYNGVALFPGQDENEMLEFHSLLCGTIP